MTDDKYWYHTRIICSRFPVQDSLDIYGRNFYTPLAKGSSSRVQIFTIVENLFL